MKKTRYWSKIRLVVQSLSHVWLQCAWLLCPPLSPKVCSDSCQWYYLTISSSAAYFSFCLQSFSASRVFSSESGLCIQKPKFWSFNFSNSPSNEYLGLISFRMDWFDLAVQGTLLSLLQHHSLKASVFQRSAFFMVQLSYPSMTIGKPIALPRQTLLAKGCPCFLIYCLGLSLEKAMAPHSSTLPGKSHGWRSLVGYSPWGR